MIAPRSLFSREMLDLLARMLGSVPQHADEIYRLCVGERPALFRDRGPTLVTDFARAVLLFCEAHLRPAPNGIEPPDPLLGPELCMQIGRFLERRHPVGSPELAVWELTQSLLFLAWDESSRTPAGQRGSWAGNSARARRSASHGGRRG